MIKAVLFDLDGVLFNSEVYDHTIMKEFLEKTNSPLPHDRVKKLICPNRETDYVGEMLEGYDIDREQFMKDLLDYLFAERRRVSYKDLMFEDVPFALKWLKDHGYKLACASSSPYDYVENNLTVADIKQYFDVFVSGHNFNKNKPAPDCYLYCRDQLGVKSEECLVVEDSYNGILSGKNAGMKVLVRNDHVLNLNQSGGDYYTDDYYDIENIIKFFDK